MAGEVDLPVGLAQRIVGEGEPVEVLAHALFVSVTRQHPEGGLSGGLRSGAGSALPARARRLGKEGRIAVGGHRRGEARGGAGAGDAEEPLRALDSLRAARSEVAVAGGEAAGKEGLAVEPALEQLQAIRVALALRAEHSGAGRSALAPGAVGGAVAADALDAQRAGCAFCAGAVSLAELRRAADEPRAALSISGARRTQARSDRRAEGRVTGVTSDEHKGKQGRESK